MCIFFFHLQAANIYNQEVKGEEKVEFSVVKHVSYSKARQQQVKRVSIGIKQITKRLTSCWLLIIGVEKDARDYADLPTVADMLYYRDFADYWCRNRDAQDYDWSLISYEISSK